MINVALERPTRSYTMGAGSLASSAAVDGAYGVDARFFTASDDGPLVVPSVVTASRSSSVYGGTSLAHVVPLAPSTAQRLVGGWPMSLVQAKVYCKVDHDDKCINVVPDTNEEKAARGCVYSITLAQCKTRCEATDNCRGVSFRIDACFPSIGCSLCILVTKTTEITCMEAHDNYNTHWYVRTVHQRNTIFTTYDDHGFYGGHVDTGISTTVADLRTISFWMKMPRYPKTAPNQPPEGNSSGVFTGATCCKDTTVLVSRATTNKGLSVIVDGDGYVKFYLMANWGSSAKGTQPRRSKSIFSDEKLELNRWYHVAVTHDRVPSSASCPISHPFVTANAKTCCDTSECQSSVSCWTNWCVSLPEMRLYIDGQLQTKTAAVTTIPQDNDMSSSNDFVKRTSGMCNDQISHVNGESPRVGVSVQTKQDCETAANKLGLSDQTVDDDDNINLSGRPSGCFFTKSGLLRFNAFSSSSVDCRSGVTLDFCICFTPIFVPPSEPASSNLGSNVLIGRGEFAYSDERAFDGQIKGVQLFDRALPKEDVVALSRNFYVDPKPSASSGCDKETANGGTTTKIPFNCPYNVLDNSSTTHWHCDELNAECWLAFEFDNNVLPETLEVVTATSLPDGYFSFEVWTSGATNDGSYGTRVQLAHRDGTYGMKNACVYFFPLLYTSIRRLCLCYRDGENTRY